MIRHSNAHVSPHDLERYVFDGTKDANRHIDNVELQQLTAEPEREPEPPMEACIGGAKGSSKGARDRAVFGPQASDKRTKPKLQPYVNPFFNKVHLLHIICCLAVNSLFGRGHVTPW